MNAVLQPRVVTTATMQAAAQSAHPPARIALLGTGTVGSAVLARLAGWTDTPLGNRLSLVYAANSRMALHDNAGLCPLATQSLAVAPASPSPAGRGVGVRVRRSADGELWPEADKPRPGFLSTPSPYPHPPSGHLLPEREGTSTSCSDPGNVVAALGHQGTRILIDATASEAVAQCHAQWLANGIHVVTACKFGAGTSLQRWRAIRAACVHGGTHYGDSATVGAGLPLLRSLRELQAGGDRIHAIAGVLSGSLAWLFHQYDGLRPFSGFVRQARAAGYTEPDPREDLSGEDVRRKLLILARSAGIELGSDAVDAQSLIPAALAGLAPHEVDAALPHLDAPLRGRYAAAYKHGQKLRFIARLQCQDPQAVRACVGLESLAADDPLAGGAGTDNRVAIWSDRYPRQPLLIQGPGAGAEVTAAALLDDVLRIARA